MNYEEALAWVHSLPRLAKHPGIENTRRLLRLLGDPQKKLRFVHIAGTNGKGSATVMLASILREAGLRTGANISPYVLEFRERFQLNGCMISYETLAEILTQVRTASEQLAQSGWDSLVEFDVVTAAALLWYAQEDCDIVCMEVGLGGRLDSTNVIEHTLVACVMSIGKDHMELLGDTDAQIAAEKCGIFKAQCDVIAYPVQSTEAMDVIRQRAQRGGCRLCVPQVSDIAPLVCDALENKVRYGRYTLEIPFLGRHQQYNAAVVVEAALALRARGFAIADADIERGIAAARLPARIEVLSRTPPVVLDGAHNPDGARALAQTLAQANLRGLAVILGVLEGKQPEEMLDALLPHCGAVYTVTPQSPRAMDAQKLAQLAAARGANVQACETFAQAVAAAQASEFAQNGLLICGSLYLAAQAREQFI